MISGPQHAERRRFTVLAVGMFAVASSSMSNLGVPVLAPAITLELHVDVGQLGLAFAAINAGITISLIPWGILADRLGERFVIAVGLLGATVALLWAAQADTFPELLAALAVTGFCNGSIHPATGRAVNFWFPPARRGFAHGVRQTGAPVGGILVAVLLPPIVAAGGLRAGFSALAVVAASAAIAGGLLLAMPSTVAEPQGELERTVHPYRDGRLWRIAWSTFFLFVAHGVTVGFTVLFLHEERGLGAGAAALVLGGVQAGGAAVRIVAGRFSDSRLRRMAPLRQLAVLISLGLLAVAASVHAPLPVCIAVIVAAGMLAIGWSSLAFTATAEAAGDRRTGTALGLQQTLLGVSASTTPIAFGWLVAATSWSAAYAMAAAFPLLGAALLRGRLLDA
jgi:MFS family permease